MDRETIRESWIRKLDDLMESYDVEIEARDKRIVDLEDEIERLKEKSC